MDHPAALAPGATIGIVGTGQLGRMLASAAARLGFRVVIFGPDDAPPAAQVANAHIQAAYDDADALARFADVIDAATYEFENIPPSTVQAIVAAGVPVRPDDQVLGVCQDRVAEKNFLNREGLATAPFFAVDSLADLNAAVATLSGPGILKSRRFGYDGKGQVRLPDGADTSAAFDALGGVPSILEGLVSFEAEISVIAARGIGGHIEYFDVPQNHHESGILVRSVVPASVPRDVQDEARALTGKLMTALDYVGVMAVEFFWGPNTGLIANEIAPRVHNTGHWTREACVTGQFEQHIRAVAGWPLGEPTRHSDAEMHNLLGAEADQWPSLAESGAAVTFYGKGEARPGRKMGHTVRLSSRRRD